jgi:glutamate-1-semialdehyde 2,1-aminomutase
MHRRSKELFERAQASIPGGVNSPVRAFKSVGGTPVFIKFATGAYLFDEDGNRYIDYINSWGPMILGHAYGPVEKAITEKVLNSTSFGAPTLSEIEMAELIKSMAPNIDLVRMVNSGTEACMSAIRLARGYTGKNKFIKFEGCYHGHADAFLVKAGSGLATLDIQSVPGVTAGSSIDTLTAPFNDLDAVKKLVRANKAQVAAIIIEPVAGNMGCILPGTGYLEGLRKICDDENIVLIFDEVMTGFRLAVGGAQEKFKVDADLVTFGKIIGGGLPVGAFGGKYEIMKMLAPMGQVYQAGTLSGNPIAMIAGITTLQNLKSNPGVYIDLEEKCDYLQKNLGHVFEKKNIPHRINFIGSMISIHFCDFEVRDFNTASAANIGLFNKFFHHMLERGIYLPPSAYESWFLSTALTYQDIDATIGAAESFSD